MSGAREVTVAGTAGFCFGVKRAVEEVYRQLAEGRPPVYTYGPIIHNEAVVEDLAARGVRILHDVAELSSVSEGTVIIRSHGVTRAEQEQMEAQGLTVVDATCPYVKKIHRIAEETGRAGDILIIAGDPAHPEVRGICGWTTGPVFVVRSREELEKLEIPEGRSCVLVAQTTFYSAKFQDIVDFFKKMHYHKNALNTVCSATEQRQAEAVTIAGMVDAMIVVGGKHSSNTQKLFDICREHCKNTYFIEKHEDLDIRSLQLYSHVGITAGASTPNSIIEEVTEHVRTEL